MIGMVIPLSSLAMLILEDHMQMRDGHVDIVRNTVALATKINHSFKLMVDRNTFQAIMEEEPKEFWETQDHMYWMPEGTTDKIMMYRNDYISGVWVEFQ